MALVYRKTSPDVQHVADLVNGARQAIGAGANFHLDASEAIVTSANASNPATAIALSNELLAVMLFHAADLLAHKGLDGDVDDDLSGLVKATDSASCVTLMAGLVTAYNDHIASTDAHYNADSTNTLTSSTVTNISQAESVATDMKAKLNLHMAGALAGQSARAVYA